ncbi:MAG: CPBP family intramembrane glutamic endopeptidase [Bacteroidota bacterium]
MKKKHPILYILVLVLILIPSILATEFGSQKLLNLFYPYNTNEQIPVNSIVYLTVSMISAFILIGIYRKFIDKKDFFSMGFSIKDRMFDFFLGFSLGIFLLFIGFFILIVSGNTEVTSIEFKPEWLLGYTVFFILVSLHEEVLVRGYLLNSLMSVSNKYFALLLSSLIFSALHLMNPGISTVSFINIVLAGLLLGSSYIHSKNLWFPLAFHFSWNFFQGPILGFEVSGHDINSFISQNISNNDLITGGIFGFEGSVITTVLLALSIVAVNWFFEKKEALKQKISIGFRNNELTIENLD